MLEDQRKQRGSTRVSKGRVIGDVERRQQLRPGPEGICIYSVCGVKPLESLPPPVPGVF